MNRDDIIRMAREAGGMDGWGVGRRISDPELRADNFVFDLEDLGRFAALVAAAVREQYEVHADLADQVAQAIRARSQA